MKTDVIAVNSQASVQRYRARIADVRARARRLFDGGATGIQVAAALSEGTDAFILELLEDALRTVPEPARVALRAHAAVIAVGGTGRGDPAPYSDVDLLFLYSGPVRPDFERVTSQLVRDFWDAGIKLGHALRGIGETVALARDDPEVATALVEARLLWGGGSLFKELQRRFARRVIRGRARAFLDRCIVARKSEKHEHGGGGTELEPDLKRSQGGLRDVHLIRWIGFARYGTADVESLRLKGALKKADARTLLKALEYITRIRCDLHFAAGKEQDVLTRDEQLRLAEERGFQAPQGQRPVEVFMQQFFQHTSAIARITRRFVALHRPESFGKKLFRNLMGHPVSGPLRVLPDCIDASPRDLIAVCSRMEGVLEMYRAAAWYRKDLSPRAVDAVAQAESNLGIEPSPRGAALFLDILKQPGHIGPVLRNMHETGILDLVIPDMAHARCLLQFNQYHQFTVDEHTLRTIEAVESFERDDGPIGTAYRAIRHKEVLHLALLLHDLGKGFPDDHSDVGRLIAEKTAERLCLPDHHRETLVFLVHKHLKMTYTAFRRDCSDPDLLLEFSREVGSPETLRMLYVLSAADLIGVGPGTFTDWKADLLTELFDRAMLVLSGKPYRFHEEERIAAIKREVCRCCEEAAPTTRLRISDCGLRNDVIRNPQSEIRNLLDSFSPQYLSATPVERIVGDLLLMRRLDAGGFLVEGVYDASNGTVEYRVLVDAALSAGCFHRITGALTSKRLEILSAQICTTAGGIAVDSFRVLDRDFAGAVPGFRMDEVADSIRTALRQTAALDGCAAAPSWAAPMETLFRRFQRYGDGKPPDPLSDQQPRVAIDNDSSEQCTVIDVFAHDRRGLLYTLTRAIFELDLSVMLAKISTHLDQVVDVFYVTDSRGEKVRDGERLKEIRTRLTETIDEFERDGHLQFVT
jgi:[protein-PII] uridylyltransferase